VGRQADEARLALALISLRHLKQPTCAHYLLVIVPPIDDLNVDHVDVVRPEPGEKIVKEVFACGEFPRRICLPIAVHSAKMTLQDKSVPPAAKRSAKVVTVSRFCPEQVDEVHACISSLANYRRNDIPTCVK